MTEEGHVETQDDLVVDVDRRGKREKTSMHHALKSLNYDRIIASSTAFGPSLLLVTSVEATSSCAPMITKSRNPPIKLFLVHYCVVPEPRAHVHLCFALAESAKKTGKLGTSFHTEGGACSETPMSDTQQNGINSTTQRGTEHRCLKHLHLFRVHLWFPLELLELAYVAKFGRR